MSNHEERIADIVKEARSMVSGLEAGQSIYLTSDGELSFGKTGCRPSLTLRVASHEEAESNSIDWDEFEDAIRRFMNMDCQDVPRQAKAE